MSEGSAINVGRTAPHQSPLDNFLLSSEVERLGRLYSKKSGVNIAFTTGVLGNVGDVYADDIAHTGKIRVGFQFGRRSLSGPNLIAQVIAERHFVSGGDIYNSGISAKLGISFPKDLTLVDLQILLGLLLLNSRGLTLEVNMARDLGVARIGVGSIVGVRQGGSNEMIDYYKVHGEAIFAISDGIALGLSIAGGQDVRAYHVGEDGKAYFVAMSENKIHPYHLENHKITAFNLGLPLQFSFGDIHNDLFNITFEPAATFTMDKLYGFSIFVGANLILSAKPN